MFTDEDRKELISIFQDLTLRTVKTLESEVLPGSITHNGNKVGMTIEFRKLYPKKTQTDQQENLNQ